ncbi:hypothetical protein ACNKU7_10490 [Microbulbifer sp. SA54]|uniref:hypothetical protein n=1 Tax=Microbulbifer sp. SA54 TaxID=3401577 RepID=UPI003AADCFD9
MSSDGYLTIQIRQRVLVSLIARRQLTAEQLRGLTPAAHRALRSILLESLKEAGPGG